MHLAQRIRNFFNLFVIVKRNGYWLQSVVSFFQWSNEIKVTGWQTRPIRKVSSCAQLIFLNFALVTVNKSSRNLLLISIDHIF